MSKSKIDGGLRHAFRVGIPQAQWTSIETGATAAGVPDSEFCFPGGTSGWVEFKQISGWVVTLRPAQIGWLLRRSRMGGRCFVAVRKDSALYVLPGAQAVELREVGVRSAQPVAGSSPSGWDWAEVARILTR